MDWRKHIFVEHLVSTLRAKRRLFSGFALCLALSLLAFYLLIPITSTTDTSFSPFFSWFSSFPNARNSSSSRPTKPNSTETANATERSHFYGNYTGLEKTHLTNSSLGGGSGSASEKSPTFGSNSSRSSAESGVEKGQIAKRPSGGGAEMESVGVVGKSNGSGSSEGEGSKGVVSKKCDIFDGTWVRDDDRKPYYPPGSCPHIDIDFNCIKNGRPDSDFLKWRWQPNGCNIPWLNATDFMERLRGKRLIFVGDSLNRNMWESLVCILRQSVADKKRVFEISGKSQFKTRGYYAFKFKDYNCNIEFVQSTFLVKEIYVKGPSGKVEEKLRLDLLDQATSAYRDAAVVVFNTGHWWTHDKTKKGENYYQEGNYVHPLLKVNKAYTKALTTWAKWVDKYINPDKTRVIFRGYSHIHFRGGRWNSGGQCHKETEPIFNQTFLKKYPAKMRILEQVLKQIKTPVTFLNISRLTDYRKDGHPSIYRKRYKTVEEQIAAESSQDCSHWCLPGIPDTWNELLYASLLMDGKGSWKT